MCRAIIGRIVLAASFALACPGRARAEDRCQPGGAWLGDSTTLAVSVGDWIGSIDELSRLPQSPASWTERTRVRTAIHTLVVLEWVGNETALVVLAPRDGGFCVVTGWGFSFGGLGVEVSIADLATVFHDQGYTELVLLESLATYNNPADDLSDPTEPHRTALAVGPTHVGLVADTRQARFAPLSGWHWFFEEAQRGIALRMSRGGRVRSFRIDPETLDLLGP